MDRLAAHQTVRLTDVSSRDGHIAAMVGRSAGLDRTNGLVGTIAAAGLPGPDWTGKTRRWPVIA
jgi:hypothetical protein